jgi:hypothetical protein
MSGSMTRRGILTGAAALAGVTTLPIFASVPTMGHVVVDDRLAPSAVFARTRPAARIHRVNALDDLCHRWYTQLRAQVLADGRQIAGLTTWMDYIVMRSCAAEIGHVRTAYAEHREAGQVRWVRWEFSPRSV